MALVKCPDCGKMISSRAKACPECGCPSEFFGEESRDVDENTKSDDLTDDEQNADASEPDNNSITDGQAITYRGEGFVVVEPVLEIIKNAIETQKELEKLETQKKEIKRKIRELDENKAQKDVYDLKRYEEAKRTKKEDYEKKIKVLSDKFFYVFDRYLILCSHINVSGKYSEKKALEFIYEKMSSSQCSLQMACEAYDKQLLLEQRKRQLEEEQRRRAEEAQRIRNEEQNKRNYRIVDPQQQNMGGQYRRVDDYDDHRASYDDQYYAEEPSRGSVLGGFVRDVTATAIGSSIANRGIKKELRRQREEEERREKERRNEEDRRKREAAHRSQVEWEKVRKANEERRRKGQPELPYPDRFYW